MAAEQINPQPLPPRHDIVVSELLQNNAVDYAVIASALAKFGPSLALTGDPGENFCGTGRHYVRLYRLGPIPHPGAGPVDYRDIAETLGR